MEWVLALIEAAALTAAELLALLFIVLAAAILRGYAGFGFSAIVVAAASLFMPTREAVPLVLMMEVIASMQMARQVWTHVDWRLVGYIIIAVAVSIPVGQWFLRHVDVEAMRLLAALVLLVAVAAVAGGRFFTLKNAPPAWLLTGAVSGFMNGLLAMGGMWTVMFLLNSGIHVAALRACLVALFFITDTYALAVAAVYDLVDVKLLARAVCVLPALLLGVKIGAGKFDAEREALYKKVVLGTLTVLALLLIGRQIA